MRQYLKTIEMQREIDRTEGTIIEKIQQVADRFGITKDEAAQQLRLWQKTATTDQK